MLYEHGLLGGWVRSERGHVHVRQDAVPTNGFNGPAGSKAPTKSWA
ncbi:hypothetical protein [Isoptericola halotolerans]|uniref:Uncharacterized protein n=1 Tax=Isoptericola halotolerans TaxID=300560 RepID=A0ABX1ZZ81_9MICO|nr:hypothetical protein [Isoptericola halotolerans]NOV95920.1 hypothetical protein [Isoptericola halotolerans]